MEFLPRHRMEVESVVKFGVKFMSLVTMWELTFLRLGTDEEDTRGEIDFCFKVLFESVIFKLMMAPFLDCFVLIDDLLLFGLYCRLLMSLIISSCPFACKILQVIVS